MHPAPQPPSVLSSYVRRDQVRPRFQRVGAMVRVRPIGTTAIVCLKLGFPVACVAIRGGRLITSSQSTSEGMTPWAT